MRRLAIPLAVLMLGGCGVTSAAAKSIYDPDIGWTTAERQRLHLPRAPTRICRREPTKAQIHLQNVIDKLGDPTEGLRRIFHYRWGSGWYDPCDGGRLHVAVVPSEAAGMPRARALIARRHLTPYVRFNAVRSTWRELGDVQTVAAPVNVVVHDTKADDFAVELL